MIKSENPKSLLSSRLAALAYELKHEELGKLAREADVLETGRDAMEREIYALRVGEEAPKDDPITTSWWRLVDEVKALRQALVKVVDVLLIGGSLSSEECTHLRKLAAKGRR